MSTQKNMPGAMAETPGQVGTVADSASRGKSLYRDKPVTPNPVNGKR